MAKATHGSTLTLSVTQAAQLLGIDRRTYLRAARGGEVPLLRCGRRLLVPRVPFMRLLNARPAAEESGIRCVYGCGQKREKDDAHNRCWTCRADDRAVRADADADAAWEAPRRAYDAP